MNARDEWPSPGGWQVAGAGLRALIAWQWNGGQLICPDCLTRGTGLWLSDRFPEWSDLLGEVYPWTADADALEEDLTCDVCGRVIVSAPTFEEEE